MALTTVAACKPDLLDVCLASEVLFDQFHFIGGRRDSRHSSRRGRLSYKVPSQLVVALFVSKALEVVYLELGAALVEG